jgi:membrane protein
VYGAAGSIILILSWVYYSAIILFFGAEFTKVYANTFGQKIIPNRYSVKIEKGILS